MFKPIVSLKTPLVVRLPFEAVTLKLLPTDKSETKFVVDITLKSPEAFIESVVTELEVTVSEVNDVGLMLEW